MDIKEAYAAVRRMEAMISDYSESGKELKSKIKKEYEGALEYFDRLSKENNIKDSF